MDGNFRLGACEMVADTQGKPGGEGAVFQRVVQPFEGDPLRIGTHAEYGYGAAAPGREPKHSVFHHGDDVVISDQITHRIPVCQKLQGLEIGDGVIKPGAVQAAIEPKFPVSQGKPLADSQHGIGIVLFHREHIGPLGGEAQGIEIPQDDMGGDI